MATICLIVRNAFESPVTPGKWYGTVTELYVNESEVHGIRDLVDANRTIDLTADEISIQNLEEFFHIRNTLEFRESLVKEFDHDIPIDVAVQVVHVAYVLRSMYVFRVMAKVVLDRLDELENSDTMRRNCFFLLPEDME